MFHYYLLLLKKGITEEKNRQKSVIFNTVFGVFIPVFACVQRVHKLFNKREHRREEEEVKKITSCQVKLIPVIQH